MTGQEFGWPVSVKAVLGWDGRYVVLRNPRDEWELPGGRLDPDDEDLQAALRRELLEELDIAAAVGPIVDTWIYDVDGKRVVIVTYLCTAEKPEALWHSDEHSGVATMTVDELRSAPIPAEYLRSIESTQAAGGRR